MGKRARCDNCNWYGMVDKKPTFIVFVKSKPKGVWRSEKAVECPRCQEAIRIERRK